MRTVMYYRGCADGYEFALGKAFGISRPALPYFETPDEEYDYLRGFDDGYDSVD